VPRAPTTTPPPPAPPAPKPLFTLPPRALGLARDRAQSATAQADLAGNADVRTLFGDPQVAVYGPAPSVVAYVGASLATDDQRAVADFTAIYNRNAVVDLGAGAGIRTLEDGGVGRCWATTISGTRTHVCVIAADGVLFALVDPREPNDLSKAAARIRSVRAAALA
jgi:hypothetical protein